MRITLEMVRQAYKAIGGEGCAMRAEFFSQNYDHETHESAPACCGLSALYLEKHGGMLGGINMGLGHLSEHVLNELEDEPQGIIVSDLSAHFDVTHAYLNGWMLGFDSTSLEALFQRHSATDKGLLQGFEDGKTVGDVIFAEQGTPND